MDAPSAEEALLVIAEARFPAETYLPFVDELQAMGLSVRCDVDERGPFNGVFLYLPTVIAVLFAKPFFDAIAKKAGEDAYPHLKRATFSLVKRVGAIPLKIIGKQPDERSNAFQRGLSFYAQLNDRRRAKFLVYRDATDAEYQASVDQMCDLLASHYAEGVEDRLAQLCEESTNARRLILLHFDVASGGWKVFHPTTPDGRPLP